MLAISFILCPNPSSIYSRNFETWHFVHVWDYVFRQNAKTLNNISFLVKYSDLKFKVIFSWNGNIFLFFSSCYHCYAHWSLIGCCQKCNGPLFFLKRSVYMTNFGVYSPYYHLKFPNGFIHIFAKNQIIIPYLLRFMISYSLS